VGRQHPSPHNACLASPTTTLQIAPSGIHGLGAFFTTDLPAGALLGSYGGRRLTAEQLAAKDWDYQVTYLFSMSNGNTIDGGRGGNACWAARPGRRRTTASMNSSSASASLGALMGRATSTIRACPIARLRRS
jgi:hypothetical protein